MPVVPALGRLRQEDQEFEVRGWSQPKLHSENLSPEPKKIP
jgi:hypothetical protein